MIFKRKLYDKLLVWKQQTAGTKALLIEGARRIGKSTLVEEFAKNEYRSYLMIDFNKVSDSVISAFNNYMNDLDTFFLILSSEYGVRLYPKESIIEARTFEAMLSAFRTFADRLDTLCRLYGDMEEKKWLDNQEVCLLLKVSPRTLQTLRDNGTLAYTQICHKTYYKPGDVESIIRIVEERRKRAESMGRSI